MEREYDDWGAEERPARRSKKRWEVHSDDDFDRPRKKAARRARHVEDEDEDQEEDLDIEEEDDDYDDDDDDDDDDLDVRRTRRRGPRDAEQSSHKLYGESLSGDELDDIINEEWVTYNDDSYDEEEDGWPYN